MGRSGQPGRAFLRQARGLGRNATDQFESQLTNGAGVGYDARLSCIIQGKKSGDVFGEIGADATEQICGFALVAHRHAGRVGADIHAIDPRDRNMCR